MIDREEDGGKPEVYEATESFEAYICEEVKLLGNDRPTVEEGISEYTKRLNPFDRTFVKKVKVLGNDRLGESY